MSKEEFDSTIPVSPPKVNRKINPRIQYIGDVKLRLIPYSVINHLNTLIPVGTAITIVAAVK